MEFADWLERKNHWASRQLDPNDRPGQTNSDVKECDRCIVNGQYNPVIGCDCEGGLFQLPTPYEEVNAENPPQWVKALRRFIDPYVLVQRYGIFKAAVLYGLANSREWHPWFLEAVVVVDMEVAQREHARRVEQAQKIREQPKK